jgi:hypothetical protein
MSMKSRAERERRLATATMEVCGCAEDERAQHSEFRPHISRGLVKVVRGWVTMWAIVVMVERQARGLVF